MPIRNNRGRAAVYRKLWGWPLRSPRHLVAAFVAVVAIAVIAGVIVSRNVPNHPQAKGGAPDYAPQVTVTAPTVPASDLPDRITSTPVPISAPPSPEALAVAQSWAKAWANHPAGVTNAQWLAGLKPYTTDEYLPVMSSVDPANIPATKVTSAASASESYASSLHAKINTDGGALDITVVKTPQGWRVAGYDPA